MRLFFNMQYYNLRKVATFRKGLKDISYYSKHKMIEMMNCVTDIIFTAIYLQF